jgi:hypothetical protein
MPDGRAMTLKRTTIISTIGLGVAAVLALAGIVLSSNARFSDHYVAKQMAQQRITFRPVDQLTDAEKQHPCVVANAGRALRTGRQAECFANEFIAVHLGQIGGGKTYAELGVEEFALVAKVDAAREAHSHTLAGLEKQLTELRATRNLLFQGETLRGMLLTSFGFSTLGAKAGQAASVAFAVAAALGLASLATFGLALARRGASRATVNGRSAVPA